MAGTTYWSKQSVLKILRRFVNQVCDGDPARLPTNFNRYDAMIRPLNQGYSQNRPLYPCAATVARLCGGLQKAWKRLGYDVEITIAPEKQAYGHIFTEEVDNKLREIYSRPNAKKNSGYQGGFGVKAYAKELGVPHHALTQRARKLGISRVKEIPWTKAEFDALVKLAHYAPDTIRQRFKELGFHRTTTAIAVMRKRTWAHKGTPYYSGAALAVLMGVDSHTPARTWIPLGLEFVAKQTTRGIKTKAQGGDIRFFHIDDIRAFFIAHPEQVDLLKVDKMWFLEMITAGAIQMLTASPRLSLRHEAPRPGLTRERPLSRKESKERTQPVAA